VRPTLLILLKPDVSAPVRAEAVEALRALGLTVAEVPLEGRCLYVVTQGAAVPPDSLLRIPGIQKVVPLEESGAPLVHATHDGGPRTVCLGNAHFGGGSLGVIAGPCTVESGDDLQQTAHAVASAGAAALRGGVFKVRTSPHSFQGGGAAALDLLIAASQETGLPFFTELNDPRQVALLGDRLDGVQIGARHMQNFPLLKEVATLGKPVLLKRHMAADVDEWLLAAEYLLDAGNEQVILCERGVKSVGRHVRSMLDLGAIPYLKRRVGLPIVVDPSHAAGHHDLVPDLARAAVAAGADGLIIEVHPRPEQTRCDALQALLPSEFSKLMGDVRQLAAMSGRTVSGTVRAVRGAVRESAPDSDVSDRNRSVGA
jgi:3-deoxy-7-phosphoheptulonate synthase